MLNSRKIFAHIYDKYINQIFRFIFLKVETREIAEDITSEVFIRTWNAIKQGTDIKNHRAFLYKVARNLIVNHYREKTKIQAIALCDCKEIQDSSLDVEQKLILKSDFNIVKTAINNLEGYYQDVIIWRYLDEMSISEISKILNKPEGTIRVILHRGLKILRNQLS